MITAESKAKLFEKTYDAYLLAQSVTRVYGVESPPGQSAMKKLRAEMKACSDRDLLEEYLDYQNRENKRIESIWGGVVSLRNYDYKEQIQRRKELQKMDFISGVQAGRLIRHFLNTFEPDITVKRFRKRYKELQKDLREDVPHKVLYSSRGTRYYWLQENVLSFLRNRINVKSIDK